MLKKTVLTFAFLTILTTFYGFNATFSSSATDMLENQEADLHTLLDEGEYVISAYDNIIRHVSTEEGQDWRLMSAIAYHESRFRSDVVSKQGARGLMQIMPSIARHYEVSTEQIIDPVTNVRVANKLIASISRSLRMPASVPEKDRMSLILASYNGGIGHVIDARRLARLNGENPNSWEVVARYLQLKAQPEYYENDVVECGRFTGSRQTLAYVNNVIDHYKQYCLIAQK